MHEVLDKILLSAIAISVTFSFFSVVDEQIVGCTQTHPFLSTYCPFSLNTWNINEAGHAALQIVREDTLFLLDALKVAPLLHFLIGLIGWILYVVNLRLTAAFTIALAHINGWIILDAFLFHQKDFNRVASVLTLVDHDVFSFDHWSIGVMASVTASILQLVIVVTILIRTCLS